MRQSFSTKAGTLKDLKVIKQHVLLNTSFSVSEWQFDSKSCLLSIEKNLGKVSKIVRSSSAREDSNSIQMLELFFPF